MDKTPSISPLDAALENLDPTRRKFLGLMMAGAAALPALATTSLAAQDANKSDSHIIKPSVSGSQQKTAPNAIYKDQSPSQNRNSGHFQKIPRDASADKTVKGSDSQAMKDSGSQTKDSSKNVKSTMKDSGAQAFKDSSSKTVKSPDATQKGSSPAETAKPKPNPAPSSPPINMK